MLQSTSESRDSVVVLSLRGELDVLTSDDMNRVTQGLQAKGVRKVVFDLNELSLLDSSGVQTIMSLYKFIRLNRGEVTVANLKHQPKEVFKILNMHRLIRIYDSVDQAVESLHQLP